MDNALRVLLLLAEQDEVRVSQVASELGIGLSTAHRLLTTLRLRGFAEQRPGRAYSKGEAFARLAGAPPVRPLEEVAVPYLQRLRDEADETAHFAVLDGAEMLFLASVECDQALRVGSRVGARMPAHVTAAGKAVLAALPPDRLARALGPSGPQAPGLEAETIARLRRELAGVRRQGYGVNRAQTERGTAAVGVAVLGRDGEPVGALSLSVPTVRLSAARVEDMARLLRRVRVGMERELAEV